MFVSYAVQLLFVECDQVSVYFILALVYVCRRFIICLITLPHQHVPGACLPTLFTPTQACKVATVSRILPVYRVYFSCVKKGFVSATIHGVEFRCDVYNLFHYYMLRCTLNNIILGYFLEFLCLKGLFSLKEINFDISPDVIKLYLYFMSAD